MRIASGEFLRFSHPRRRRRLHPVARDFGRALRVVAVLVPLMIFVYWLIAAESFALAEIEIKENPRVPASWMRRAIEAELGGNLVILPLSRVRERLSGHPWLANVEVHKELPDRLFVEVDERLAVAVLEAEDGAYFIDGSGRRIASVRPGESAVGLLRLASGGSGSEVPAPLALQERLCLEKAIQLSRALADADLVNWRSRLLRIEVVGDDDFRLFAENLPFPVLVRSASVVAGARVLDALLPEILARTSSVYEVDLRFQGRVVVRPEMNGDRRQQKET